jgi:hypothetical protein
MAGAAPSRRWQHRFLEVFMGRSGYGLFLLTGAALVLLGALGFAIPIFTTQQTKDVAKIGDLKLQTTESTSFVIPPVLSGGVLLLGVVLIGAGFYQRRGSATAPTR